MKKTLIVMMFIPMLVVAARAQNADLTTARGLFDEGMRLLRNGSYEAALAAFERSAVLDPKEPSTFANIGSLSIRLNRYEKAETALRTAIRLAPNEARFHSELCQALSLQKKHAAAVEACEEGVRLGPTIEDVHVARLLALQTAGRTADLQRNIDLAVGQFRNSEVILILAVDYYIGLRNWQHAASLQESLVAMRPSVARHHGVLAEIYLRLEKETESLQSARTALRLGPRDPYANFAMGLIFFELGQHDEAVESFTKAQSDDPRLAYAAYYRGMSEARRGRTQEAIAILRALVARMPDNVDFLREFGSVLSQANQYEEARTVYTNAKRLDPRSPQILSGLGMTYMMRGEFGPAIEHFEAALRLKPDSSIFRMFVDVSRARQEAVAQLPSMLADTEENTRDLRKLFALARTMAFANRFDEAEKYVKRIYELNPPEYQGYHSIGVMFSEMGRPDQAMIAYKKAIEKGQYAGSYFGLADIYRNSGNFEQASAAFAKGIELKPDTPSFMKLYGDTLLQNGKRREALEIYKRSLALAPSNTVVLFDAAVLSAKLGDKPTALAYLGTLKTLDPAYARKLERCLAIWL